VFANLLSREVLQIVPGVLPKSIPEPSDLEHESLVFVVPLSDKVVEDRLNRFTTRRGKGGDLPRGQCPCPGRVTLGWFRGPGGVVPVDSAYTIVTFDGKPTPVCLQDLVGSQRLEDEFPPPWLSCDFTNTQSPTRRTSRRACSRLSKARLYRA